MSIFVVRSVAPSVGALRRGVRGFPETHVPREDVRVRGIAKIFQPEPPTTSLWRLKKSSAEGSGDASAPVRKPSLAALSRRCLSVWR